MFIMQQLINSIYAYWTRYYKTLENQSWLRIRNRLQQSLSTLEPTATCPTYQTTSLTSSSSEATTICQRSNLSDRSEIDLSKRGNETAENLRRQSAALPAGIIRRLKSRLRFRINLARNIVSGFSRQQRAYLVANWRRVRSTRLKNRGLVVNHRASTYWLVITPALGAFEIEERPRITRCAQGR